MSRLQQLAKIITEANSGLVTTQAVKQLFEALMKFVRDFKTEMFQNMANHKAEMVSGINEAKDTARTAKAEMFAKIAKLESDLRSDIRTTTRMFEQNVKDLKDDFPEEYEDSELKQELVRIEKLIPKIYDDSKLKEEIEELESDVEKLEKEIEELKKRPMQQGGGVTNARITQAFKYILHTEEPVGDIDGVNLTYTLSQPIFAILSMSLNGETIAQLPNYTINGKTFTFSSPLPSAYSEKDWEVKYI